MESDISIAQKTKMLPITAIAKKAGLAETRRLREKVKRQRLLVLGRRSTDLGKRQSSVFVNHHSDRYSVSKVEPPEEA